MMQNIDPEAMTDGESGAYPVETIDQLLEHDEALARSIVHRLQAGACLDAYLGSEFRYLEMHLELWGKLFRLLGYSLKQNELGGETFYYLETRAAAVPSAQLSRGETFLGLYLAWHFMSQGMESMDTVAARELGEALLASFDFNMLLAVFNPVQKGRKRQRQETLKQHEQLKAWLRRCLNELHRLRFVQLGPNMRAGWDELKIYRLPGLQRFWDLARDALALDQSPEQVDLAATVSRVWERVEPDQGEEASHEQA
jgi:chromosome partition protein MukE